MRTHDVSKNSVEEDFIKRIYIINIEIIKIVIRYITNSIKKKADFLKKIKNTIAIELATQESTKFKK